MKTLSFMAPAKINWSLDVVGKRPDGYHNLHSIMQKISLYDTITIEEAKEDRLICDAELPTDEENIAFRAWLRLKEELGIGTCLHLFLHKEIPVAAGLAGGSADAAAVLNGINRFFRLDLKEDKLERLALSLGSDVPYCLMHGAAVAQGVGELLRRLPILPQYHLVVANPGFPVSTKEVFQAFSLAKVALHPDIEGLEEALLAGDIQGIGQLMGNVLEQVTLERCPQVAQLKQQMASLGLFPLMSGSGPSVFGLAWDQDAAWQAAQALAEDWPFAQAVHTL